MILQCQQSRGLARGGPGGPEPLRNLTNQLTLFKPGGQIMPLTLLPAPPDSKSYLHLCARCNEYNFTKVFSGFFEFSTFFFRLVDVCKSFFPLSYFEVCITFNFSSTAAPCHADASLHQFQ